MIIAEIGKNHNGIEKYAQEYIERCLGADVDAILFHIRERGFYKNNQNKKKELSDSFYKKAIEFTKKKKKQFGITIADPLKIPFLEKIGVDFYKILSQDITNKILIKRVLQTKKPIYISTGFSDYNEIEKVIKFVKTNIKNTKNVKLIHTTLRSNIEYVNFNAIEKLSEKFNLPIAFGNHSNNPLVLFTSIPYKPSDIFFYVKGSKVKQHQDDEHAIKLDDLKWYVNNIRDLQKSLGNGVKEKLSIEKKNCLIIGASGGIGNAITKKLAEQNHNLFLIGKNKKKLLKLKKEIKKDDNIVEIESVDLTNNKHIDRAIKKIRKIFGKIDVLINTSGVFLIKPIHKTTIEEFEESFKINVRAPFIFSKEFSKDMKKSKWGRIVNIGSSSAYAGFKDSVAYCSSKHALLGFSRALFLELKENNIRVYSISPGSTQTKMGKLSKDQDFETFLKPKEIADYVAFLISFDKQLISEEIRLNRINIK